MMLPNEPSGLSESPSEHCTFFDESGVGPLARHRFAGLLIRRECWILSWRAKCLLGAAVLLLLWGGVRTANAFLSVTRRVPARTLVVEGWVRPFAMAEAADEFRSGLYERVFTTGGPLPGTGGYSNDRNTSASVGASQLQSMGVPANVVQMVPSRVFYRDRTYSAAVALRDYMLRERIEAETLNVLTEGPHARRTRLLFAKAFGASTKIGIISVTPVDYDAAHWWRSSEGAREVLGEAIAYVYARFFFWPKTSNQLSNTP